MDQGAQQAATQSRMLRRSSIHSAILEAARRIAARDGTADLSLTAVAAEAGVGPSTVFGHFRNRDELLIAIIAEDMAGLAAHMRGVFTKNEPGRQSSATWQAPFDDDESATTPPPADAASHPQSGDVDEYPDFPVRLAEKRRSLSLLRAAPKIETQNSEADADAETADVRPRVDAWLERRLRVFEHALGDIQHRLEETERNSVRAMSIAADGTRILSDRLDGIERRHADDVQHLSERVDEGERRRLGMAAEFRAAANDASGRLEMLEAARRAEQELDLERMSAEPPPPDWLSPRLIAPFAIPAESDQQPEETETEAKEEAGEADDGYLAAARRAASAAAVLRETSVDGAKSDPIWRTFAQTRVRIARKHYVAALSAALVAFTAGGFAAFSIGAVHGRVQALKPVSLATAARARAAGSPIRIAAQTPLDRIAALANAGDPRAELIIGLKYLHGEGIAPDQPRAAQWIARAAQRKEPLAQYWMGMLYERGDGVPADAGEAVRWYEAAAAQGNRKAMHALGVAYAEGRGTQKDLSTAARWFSKAAQLGFLNSEFNLAVLYERGEGVPQSLTDAYKWYAIAAAQGDAESRARTEALKTQLSAADIAAAERAAVMFRPQNVDPKANTGPVLADLAGAASLAR
jgi:TPR repeat protein